jgi:protein SCO1
MNPRRALLAALAIVATTSAGCREHVRTDLPLPTNVAAAAPVAGPSIYPLDVALRDEQGAAIGADVFRGQPVIVSMFFGSCPAACPLLVTHIKQLEASLPAETRAQTRVLLVSFDADRDTPAALHALARAHHVDAARWRFASANDDQARVLGNALGINFRKEANGMFSHDSSIIVLDREGRIAAQREDRSEEVPLLGAAITTSL